MHASTKSNYSLKEYHKIQHSTMQIHSVHTQKNYLACKIGESVPCKQEKNKSVETDSEITEIMGLVDNNIKTVTLTIFHTLKHLEKNIE